VKLAINKIQFPVTTLGFGRRVGIWTQGCSIGCPGCVNRDTWATQPEDFVEIEEVARAYSRWPDADGVTISGGEPFEQVEALELLVSTTRQSYSGDVLVFSGFEFEELERRHSKTLALLDVVVAGPYQADAGNELTLRGSDNQTIHLLSDLAKERYPADINERKRKKRPDIDLSFTENGVYMAGITKKGGMARFRKSLAKRGYRTTTSDQKSIVSQS
jgi:anaerobic ribonucleoside-triphosphate reductase activating protein